MGPGPGDEPTLFSSVKDNLAKGLDWGVDVVRQTGATVKDGAVALYRGGKTVANQVLDGASDLAKAGVGKVTVSAARAGGGYLTGDANREAGLKRAIDRRSEYTPKEVCQTCSAAQAGANPNPNDGSYMGKDCGLSTQKPQTGKLPAGCGEGCKLPRIYFTNGINNNEKQVCETITAIAELRCAEVVGIYNATYADADKVVAPGASQPPRVQRDAPPWYRPDKLVANALGDKWAGLKHSLADKVGEQGLVMDVLDCLDNIDGAGTEAAAATQRQMLLDSLSTDPPQAVTLYAHSQGGLITQEGLQQARRALYAREYQAGMSRGLPPDDVERSATQYANERMSHVSVTSFGTAEAGWPEGPTYQHNTNSRDPVPQLIKAVQENRGVDTAATGGPVHAFTNSPSFDDPMAAHGMKEAYLPEFAKTATAPRTNGKCCP